MPDFPEAAPTTVIRVRRDDDLNELVERPGMTESMIPQMLSIVKRIASLPHLCFEMKTTVGQLQEPSKPFLLTPFMEPRRAHATWYARLRSRIDDRELWKIVDIQIWRGKDPERRVVVFVMKSFLDGIDRDSAAASMLVPRGVADRCAKCGGSQGSLRLCSGCKVARYCSDACHKGDWKAHKPKCAVWRNADIVVEDDDDDSRASARAERRFQGFIESVKRDPDARLVAAAHMHSWQSDGSLVVICETEERAQRILRVELNEISPGVSVTWRGGPPVPEGVFGVIFEKLPLGDLADTVGKLHQNGGVVYLLEDVDAPELEDFVSRCQGVLEGRDPDEFGMVTAALLRHNLTDAEFHTYRILS